MTLEPRRVYLGLGANVGNREANIEAALDVLHEDGIGIATRSSWYASEPWGVTDQAEFLNIAVTVITAVEPHDLLRLAKAAEQAVGREPTYRWGPRAVDVDLLLDEAGPVDDPPWLVLPHPRLAERRFVLEPLLELNPDLRDLDGRPLADALAALPLEPRVRRLPAR